MQGIVVVNKPEGLTSQAVVSKVKKILNEKKVGHTGTLDPLATGVLPILLGNATKISKYLIEHDKKYIAKVKFGEKKDTGDREGKTIEISKNKVYNENEILEVLKNFIGKQIQTPPKYSAIKVNGKKLYEYARKNIDVEIPKREIEIYDLKLLNFDFETQEIEIEVSCSKGTYIRTLCEDISDALGTVGFMNSLKRIKVGEFDINMSITLEELEENKDKVISIQQFFNNYDKIILNKRKEELFLNGVKLTFNLENGLYNIYSEEGNYIGIGVIQNNLLKRDVIL